MYMYLDRLDKYMTAIGIGSRTMEGPRHGESSFWPMALLLQHLSPSPMS